ncbi:MAG TPA: FAD:protein FMN transferase [Acidimicrobiales bacterium]|nr:FAD:protein FMN transferase [Acidimicrobiales bacterium]
MGTRARLLVLDEPYGLSARLRDRVLELEARWSRFLPDSEVSRLNRAGGAPLRVSVETRELVSRAVEGWEATYGLFDPTVLGDLERAGYDRPFDELGDRRPADAAPRSWLRRGCDGVEVDHVAGTVRLPAGVGFDPGGIGKGYAADLVTAEAIAAGAAGVLVDLGGDIRVRGVPPERKGCWRIGVDDPRGDRTLGPVLLADGAVATSTRTRRRWSTPDGERRHHLIDPLMGRPTDSDVLSATAVAAEGWQAEVLAKAAFVGGQVQGVGVVDRLGGAALVVDAGGGVTPGPTWGDYVDEAA